MWNSNFNNSIKIFLSNKNSTYEIDSLNSINPIDPKEVAYLSESLS